MVLTMEILIPLLGLVLLAGTIYGVNRLHPPEGVERLGWRGRMGEMLGAFWDWRDRPRGDGPLGDGGTDPDPRPVRAAPPMPAPPPAPPRRAERPAAPATGPLPAGGSAAQGDALMAINSLVAEAYHGPLKNVHLVISTLSAIQDGTGKGLVSLGRRLAEPDKDYGSAIWEPVVAAGFQAQSGAMKLAEADAGLSVLAHTTVGEASQSPAIHVPHNSQLNGAA
jgi:hypothetical protein